jgi:hypothetical protein
VGIALKPIYERLGDPALLARCLDGKTQNSNETFHFMLWRSCPKERWACMRTVDLAIAVQRFNKGSSALLDVMVELEVVTDSIIVNYAEKKDLQRVKTSSRKSLEKARKRQKIDGVRRQEC